MTKAISKIVRSKAFESPLMAPFKNLADQVRLGLWNLSKEDRRHWHQRIKDVLECPDIEFIATHEDAGKIIDGFLIMHNGLKIEPLSYYGYPMLRMFKKSRGIHEPQEERIFLEVLKVMPDHAVMLELGSYWAFYSMCFCHAVREAQSYLIEPTDFGLAFGQRNFEINNFSGNFTLAYAGKTAGQAEDGIKIVCVDEFAAEKKLDFIDILHADIQGFELEMLMGASRMLEEKRAGYIFVSTHSNELHFSCIERLRVHGYKIITSIDLSETYSLDGLIVAHNPDYPAIDPIELSRKTTLQSHAVV